MLYDICGYYIKHFLESTLNIHAVLYVLSVLCFESLKMFRTNTCTIY